MFSRFMPPLLRRRANLYLLITYLMLSAVPFVPLLLGKAVERPWQLLGVECVAWMAVWAVFKRPAYFHWLLIPAFLALPTELYLHIYYGQGISTHHLGIIAETSPSEAAEFLGSTVWLMLGVMLAALAWLVTSWRAALATRDLDWDDGSRWVALGLLGVAALVAAYGHEFGVEGKAGAVRPAAGSPAGPRAGNKSPGSTAVTASAGNPDSVAGGARRPGGAQNHAASLAAAGGQAAGTSAAPGHAAGTAAANGAVGPRGTPQLPASTVATGSNPGATSRAAGPAVAARQTPNAIAATLPPAGTPGAAGLAARPASAAGTSAVAPGASGKAAAKKASIPAHDRPLPAANHTGLKWPALPHLARLPIEFDAFASSWPYGLVGRGRAFYKERQYLAELGARNANFKFGARQFPADPEPEIVVMVIGESSRADRWSLNGYARQTNPLLSQEPNLVNLPDVITSVSATRLSVPVMISRKPVMKSLKNGFNEKSFLTAYKEAGFKTFWLSNQVSFGEFDTPVSVFAREADVVQFLNLGGFTNQSNFDDILLGPLSNAIADKARKKLIVLHTLGSHWNYSQRYPKQFDRWQPSLFGVDKPVVTDVKIKLTLNNSYDSTILYTDWLLSQVIGRLKQAQQRSAMMYMADHGQALYDNSCDMAFHGHNTEYDFHVPGLVWLSDAFLAARPEKAALLRKHRAARLSTENVFHTLLDLSNIRYPDERLERSFVNPRFTEHTRYVDSYGWSDYDNSTRKGDCREIIDKGTPLKREK